MKRPVIVHVAVLLFALSLPMAVMRVISSLPRGSSQALFVALFLVALNAAVIVWLGAFPRTARVPTIVGLCFKLAGSAASIYYALVVSRGLSFGSGLFLALASFLLVLVVSVNFVFGAQSKQYFSSLGGNV